MRVKLLSPKELEIVSPGRAPLNRYDLLAVVALAGLVVAFFHNALIGGEQFFAGDTYRFFYPLKKLAAGYVRGGITPVWNPFVHSGMPLHAALQAAIFYPFSALFYLLPFDFAYKWYVALHVLLAALGMYFLMRRWSLGHIPAAFASVTYAFSGYTISFIDGLNIFSSIVWLPLIFLLFECAVESPRISSIVLVSLPLAAQTLVGDPVSAYYTFLICGAYWLVVIARSSLRRRPRAETVMKFTIFPIVAFLAFLLSYVQALPSQELTQYSTRTIGIEYQNATQHSLVPAQLLTLFVPYLFGNLIENVYDWGRIFAPHFPLVRSLYVGALPLILVPIAIAVFKDRRVYFFTGVLVIGLFLSLGKYTPIYAVAYRLLPMFGKFRYPTKAFFAATFAAAVLAGYGLEYLVSRNPDTEHRVRQWAAKFISEYAAVLLPITLAWFLFALCDEFLFRLTDSLLIRASSADASVTAQFIPFMKQQLFRASIVFGAIGVLLWMRQKGTLSHRVFAAIALGSIAIDLLPVNYRAMDTAPESFYTPPRIASVLGADGVNFRLYRTPLDLEQHIEGMTFKTPADYYLWNRELLSPNFGTLFGYAYTDGYESANLLWHNMFIRFVEGSPALIRPKLLGLVNVKYIFSPHPVSHPDLALRSALSGNVYLYGNTRCLDRAYFVPVSIVASSETVALNVLASDVFDPNQAVVLVDKGGPGSLNPEPGILGFQVATPRDFTFQTMDVPEGRVPERRPAAEKGPNPVKILKYSPNSVSLSVDAPSDGYVVLCDAYYPKWRAYVNGKRVNILRANSTVRAVSVTAGNNSIEFVYDTASFRSAARVSLVVLVVCIVGAGSDIFWRVRRSGGKRATGAPA